MKSRIKVLWSEACIDSRCYRTVFLFVTSAEKVIAIPQNDRRSHPNLTYTATNWSFSTNWRFSRFLFFWGYQERVVECFGSRNSSNAKEESRVWPQRMGDWITLKIAADNEVFTLEDHESWGSLGITRHPRLTLLVNCQPRKAKDSNPPPDMSCQICQRTCQNICPWI